MKAIFVKYAGAVLYKNFKKVRILRKEKIRTNESLFELYEIITVSQVI